MPCRMHLRPAPRCARSAQPLRKSLRAHHIPSAFRRARHRRRTAALSRANDCCDGRPPALQYASRDVCAAHRGWAARRFRVAFVPVPPRGPNVTAPPGHCGRRRCASLAGRRTSAAKSRSKSRVPPRLPLRPRPHAWANRPAPHADCTTGLRRCHICTGTWAHPKARCHVGLGPPCLAHGRTETERVRATPSLGGRRPAARGSIVRGR